MVQKTLEALSSLTFLEWLLLFAILSLIAWITSRFEKPNLPEKKYRLYILIGLAILFVVFIKQMSSDVLTSVKEVQHGIIDFEMAKTQLRQKMQDEKLRERLGEWADGLEKKADIKINDDLLKTD